MLVILKLPIHVNPLKKGRAKRMNKAKIWFAAGLVLLLFGIGYGVTVFKQTHVDVNKEISHDAEAQAVFSRQVIDYGAFGRDVYELQGRLSFLGFYKGKLDSSFGPKTKRALKRFQAEFGMKPDGIAGARTKLKLYNATKKWRPGMELTRKAATTKAKAKAKNQKTVAKKNTGKVKATSTDLSPSNGMGLSANDLKIMANAVYGEARGEPFEGQVAVAAVILNRVKSPSFPNTASGVIFQPGAFTAVADGQIWLEPNETARKAVQQALNGWDPSGGCIYYFNPNTATSKWIWSRPQVKTIGEHIFCM